MGGEHVTIKISIDERNFELTIPQQDEALVKKAAEMVNEKVAKLKESYQTHDKRDYLAMASLLFCVNQLKSEAKRDADKTADSDTEDQLLAVENKLKTFFNE